MATLHERISARDAAWRLKRPALLRGKLAGNALFLGATLVAAVFLVFAIAPQAIVPFDPTTNSLSARHEAPGFVDSQGGYHLLGTDHMGRDVWSRLVWASRVSLVIGFMGLVLGGSVGTFIGLISGFRGGCRPGLHAGGGRLSQLSLHPHCHRLGGPDRHRYYEPDYHCGGA